MKWGLLTKARPQLRAIDFACNDPDNGEFAGKVWRAEVDDNEIEAPGHRPVAFTVTRDGFRIHRKEFEVVRSKDWLGNWCWNRYWLKPEEHERLIEHLRMSSWRCSCGESAFKDRFNAERAA